MIIIIITNIIIVFLLNLNVDHSRRILSLAS